MAPAITIIEYQNDWPGEFEKLRTGLADSLGKRALRIDHIGSTAVPDLAAKDIIDVQITVASLDDEDSLDTALQAIGALVIPTATDHCPPGMTLAPSELRKRLYHIKKDPRPANIHVRVEGRFNQRYPLLCRDYLRTHPAAAAAYAEIKRQLARHFVDDVEAYYDVKDPVFDLIMTGARDWATATDWEPS